MFKIAVSASLLWAGAASAQSIHDLGVVPSHTVSKGYDINQDGTVAVGYSAAASLTPMRAFRWTLSGGMQDLGTIAGAPQSYARAVSQDGTRVAAGIETAGGLGYGALWTTASPANIVPITSPYNGNVFRPNGMSKNGLVLVGRGASPTGNGAARWDSVNGFQKLTPDGPFSFVDQAFAANQDGSRIVGYVEPTLNTRYSYRWVNGVYTGFGPFDLGKNELYAINPAGNVMAGVFYLATPFVNPRTAFRRYDVGASFGVDQIAALPGRVDSYAYGLSVDGNVVVGASTGGPFAQPSSGLLWSTTMGLWDLNGFLANQGINLAGWHILEARALSTDGTAMVGTAIHNGQEHAFVARGITCLQKPTILSQSSDVTLCPGASAFYSVSPGGPNTTTFTYNWRRNGILISDGPNAYGSVYSGTQAANFAIFGITNNDAAVYDCVVGNACGTAISAPVNLNMAAPGPPVIFGLPAPVAVCNNTNASFTITEFNATTYNWEIYLPASGWTLVGNGLFVDFFSGWSCFITGANTPTITFNGINMASLTNIPVRCGLANACYSIFPSEPSSIYLDVPPSIITQTPDKDECYPTPTNLTVIPTTAYPTTYQWQKLNPYTAVWYNLPNGFLTELVSSFSAVYSNPQSSNLSFTVLDVASHPLAAQYRCLVSNGCGTTIAPVITHSWHCNYLCPADFDASGGTPDNNDVNAFWAAWLNGDECADVDCSGGTPDNADVQLFYDLWLAGGCDVPCPLCP